MTIELPWPPKQLSPNARLHWRAMHKAKQAYKIACTAALMAQAVPVASEGRIALRIEIRPPDRRKRDRDNLQHSLKYGLDCLARSMGVDDYLFDPSYTFGEPVKGGKVFVTVGGAL
jgi:crossover junction endodeoxyribonuclease RusA